MSRCYEEHGMTGTVEHSAWINMKQRVQREDYVKRNIKCCELFQKSFLAFYKEIGDRPSSMMSVERIDNDKGYEPGNIKWATPKEQSNNTSKCKLIAYNGETMNIKQWSEKVGIPYMTLRSRLKNGWNFKEAIETKLDTRYQRKLTQKT